MSFIFHQLRNKGVKNYRRMYRKYPPILSLALKKYSSRDTIPLTRVSVEDPDPGCGIGFFRISDPKTHI